MGGRHSLLCKLLLFVLASARCSYKGQEHVLSLIFLGKKWDKYRAGVEEKELGRRKRGSVAKLDGSKAFSLQEMVFGGGHKSSRSYDREY